jgi:predicted amidohydrolase YtcJ
MKRLIVYLLCALLLAACVGPGQEFARSLAAPSFADWILLNGKILTLNETNDTVEAIAVKDGSIVAAGNDGEMRRWRGPNTKEINLGRRTVIPGLNDGHIYATAAGLNWNDEIHWERARSLAQALQQIATAAKEKPPGTWIVVAGGWTASQFAEQRLPTRVELDSAAPRHPVYLEILGQAALLNTAALKALGIARDTRDPSGGRFERDPKSGEPTGYVLGAAASRSISDKIRPARFAVARENLRSCFHELNRLGITSVSDIQTGRVDFAHRRLLNDMARSGELSLRVNFFYAPKEAANPVEQYQRVLAEISQLRQSEMFRFGGFVFPDGESELGASDAPAPLDAAAQQSLRNAVVFFANGGHRFRLYATHDRRARQLLDIIETTPRGGNSAGPRIGVTPMEQVSPQTLERVKRMGAGIIVQSRLVLLGDSLSALWSKEQLRNASPLRTILHVGVPLGAGSGGFRSSNYSPMLALSWLITGKTIADTALRDPAQNLTRLQALRAYTLGSAWFTGEEKRKGSIEPGKLADLAVLNEDYLTVPLERIPALESLLTMVGGRVVYASGQFARFAQR